MFEYYFAVDNDDDKGVPFGPVNKDNLDISRLIVDFTSWLDVNESISEISYMAVRANPSLPVPPWQADYPLDETSSIVPVDTYPLVIIDLALIHAGKAATLDVAAGTPQLSYAVSFAATAALSRRRRLVDILMAIDKPLNPDMVAVAPPILSFDVPLIINGSAILPFGFHGRVYVNNTTGSPVSVTLPPSPSIGQDVLIKDTAGNAGIWPITVLGNGQNIEGVPELVMARNYNWVTLNYTGTDWVQI